MTCKKFSIMPRSLKSRVILGIDPGLARTGYGVIAVKPGMLHAIGYGVVQTPARKPDADRLAEISRGIRTLLKKFHPDAVAVEKLFFNTNTKTAMMVSQARGVILSACGHAGVEVSEYTPLQVKMAVVGYGRADKIQIQHMVQTILNLQTAPQPDDAADALAVAICGAQLARVSKL